jgi:hypothetical protein
VAAEGVISAVAAVGVAKAAAVVVVDAD